MLRPVFALFGLVALACFGCDAAPSVGGEAIAAETTTATSTATGAGASTDGGSLAKKTFGAAITEATDTNLADIAAAPASFTDKTVRTTGKVVAVCKKAGCWMEIGDDSSRAHVKMSGHSFTVPRTSSGHTAVVQGTVKGGAPENECGSKDSCGGEENGAIAKVEIVATGVEFID
ncbi:MAG: DUF4920 domain-containing protein [Polyangiaceae bacterium]|nr:DUF4920 domain-containing protein [Polyangiaceae bacterium]